MLKVLAVCLAACLISGCSPKEAPKPLPLSPSGVSVAGTSAGGQTADELRELLTRLAAAQDTLPQNAGFDENGNMVSEQEGRTLDVAATAQAVMTALPNQAVDPVYRTIRPAVSTARLAAAERIGTYETTILDAQPGRVHNIALTVRILNNTLLEPGQEFSFNRLTGEPTVVRGFREAAVLQNGKKTQEIGGGMCQVSSTLYNAVLDAGLAVSERHPHSQPVSYVPAGRDATTYTDKDFRFINSTRQLLLLRVITDGKMVRSDLFAL